MTDLADQVVLKIREVLGSGNKSLHQPVFSGNEIDYVSSCIKSTYVSSVGEFVGRFESELAKYTSAKYAIAVVNGTAALHIALKLIGVTRGDEVLVPALSFVATANAVSYLGATPHFVDCEESTLGIDPCALREWLDNIGEKCAEGVMNRLTGKRIGAIVPMHTFGHPCKMDEIMAIAHDYSLPVVEDAAESLGSLYYGKHTGTLGKVGILSFNGNKILTTGGGGALLTNDRELAIHARHLTTTAKCNHPWSYVHDEIGYNYRMPNINAALGCAQLEQLQKFILFKRSLAERYERVVTGTQGINLFREPVGCISNYRLQTLLLEDEYSGQQDVLLEKTNYLGIMTRPAWTPLHKLQIYEEAPKAPLNIVESLSRRIINIPSGVDLK